MRDEKPAKPEGKSRALASVKAENHRFLMKVKCNAVWAMRIHMWEMKRVSMKRSQKQMLTKNEQINEVSIDYVREEKHAAWPRCENEGFL